MQASTIDLSIVVPVYNAEAWIRETVHSAVRSYSGSLEVICVDDGSQDGSARILDELAALHSCVRVFRQENQGRSAARNVGIRHARGKWIGFLDADDSILPGAFDKVLGRSSEDSSLICFLAQKSMKQATDLFATKRDINSESMAHLDAGSAIGFLSDPAYYLAKHDLNKGTRDVLSVFDALWCWTVFSKLFESSKLKETGIAFEEGLKFGEDVLFTHEFLSKTDGSVVFLPVVTHIYNVENPGTTRGYAMGDLAKLSTSFKAFGARVPCSTHPEELAWRCVEDMLFVSVRAAKYCSAVDGQREIKQLFSDERLLDFCGMLEKDRFRKMGSSVWVVWAWAFRSLRLGAFRSYWCACRFMGFLERVVERTRRRTRIERA